MEYILTATAITLSVFMYVPLWARLIHRKTSGDHSKWTWSAVFMLQWFGLSIAWLEGADALYTYYYPAHIILVGVTMFLIWRYYGR